MKKLLFKCLAGAAMVAITVMSLIAAMRIDNKEHLKPSPLFIYNDYRHVYSGDGAADVLIIGNSKALASLSSRVIEDKTKLRTYNLAYVSTNLANTKMTLNMYLKNNMHKPDFCILEVSWFSFNDNRTHFHSETASALLFKDLEPAKYIPRYPELLQGACRLLFGDLKDVVLKQREDIDPYVEYNSRAGVQTDPRMEKRPDFDRKAMEDVFPDFKAGIDADLFQDLKDIIEACRANRIRLILYTAPELPEYTKAQLDRMMVKEKIAGLALNDKVRYFDFTVDGKYWNEKYSSQLKDSHHLRAPEKFTKDFIAALSAAGVLRSY